MKATVVAMIPSSRAGTPRRKHLANCLALALCLSGSTGFAGEPTNGNAGRTLGDSIVVTNCNDSGAGSLRAAVDGAPNDSTIDMSNLTCGIIALEDPLFINQTDLNLMGSSVSGIPTPTIEAAAGNQGGLLRHSGTGSLILNYLTIAAGAKYYDASTTDKYARGGCILSNGSVYVRDSKVKYCSATNAGAGSAAGGAIYAAGDVTLSRSSLYSNSVFATEAANGGGVVAKGQFSMFNSTLRDNDATSSGGLARAGGAWASDGGYITHSTISGNTAASVGGLALHGGAATIVDSTISGNQALGTTASTAGIYLSPTASGGVTIDNCTITANISSNNADNTAAGLFISTSGTVSLVSNIISGNSYFDGANYFPSDFVAFHPLTGHHNLVGYTPPGSTTIPADSIRQYDTPLGPLQDNGGYTETHMPLKGSWAFNLGWHHAVVPLRKSGPLDQRFDPRLVGAGVDIGSVETDSLFVGRFEQPERGGG